MRGDKNTVETFRVREGENKGEGSETETGTDREK